MDETNKDNKINWKLIRFEEKEFVWSCLHMGSLKWEENVHLKDRWKIIFGKKINRKVKFGEWLTCESWSLKKNQHEGRFLKRDQHEGQFLKSKWFKPIFWKRKSTAGLIFFFEDNGSKPILENKINTRVDFFEDNGSKLKKKINTRFDFLKIMVRNQFWKRKSTQGLIF